MITKPTAQTKFQGIISNNVNLYISVASVVPPKFTHSLELPRLIVPKTITTAADSPIILPIARITPLIICGSACGRAIFTAELVFVDPSAKEAFVVFLGTELIASCVVCETVGIIINVKISAPANGANLSAEASGKNIAAPIKPKTNEGIPARTSMPIVNILVNFVFLANTAK